MRGVLSPYLPRDRRGLGSFPSGLAYTGCVAAEESVRRLLTEGTRSAESVPTPLTQVTHSVTWVLHHTGEVIAFIKVVLFLCPSCLMQFYFF